MAAQAEALLTLLLATLGGGMNRTYFKHTVPVLHELRLLLPAETGAWAEALLLGGPDGFPAPRAAADARQQFLFALKRDRAGGGGGGRRWQWRRAVAGGRLTLFFLRPPMRGRFTVGRQHDALARTGRFVSAALPGTIGVNGIMVNTTSSAPDATIPRGAR